MAPGQARHSEANPNGRRRIRPDSLIARVAAKLKRRPARAYRWRQHIVQPVIGQIKQARGFRQFCCAASQRSDEWALICTAHHLTKLLAARVARRRCARPHYRHARHSPHLPRPDRRPTRAITGTGN